MAPRAAGSPKPIVPRPPEEMKLRERVKRRGFVTEAFNALADSLVSDCTLTELSDYAERLGDYSLSEILSPAGEASLGEVYVEFHIDEKALRELVLDLFYTAEDS